MRDLEAVVSEIVDRQAIHDNIMRYCRGIDRMDRALVADCFHPDAHDEHGNFAGTVGEFMAWVWPLLAKYNTTMHFIGNHHSEVKGNAAVAETYGIAIHRSDDPAPHRNLDIGFRYVDRFERRDSGQWRIARRVATTEWVESADPARAFPPADGIRVGQRNRSDVLYQMLADLSS